MNEATMKMRLEKALDFLNHEYDNPRCIEHREAVLSVLIDIATTFSHEEISAVDVEVIGYPDKSDFSGVR